MHSPKHGILMPNTANKPKISRMSAGGGSTHAKGRRRRATIGLAVAGLLALAPGASAASLDTLLPTGSGLTHPAGMAQDDGGHVWVSDPIMGICRVDTITKKLVEDGTYCAEIVEPPDGAPVPPAVRPAEGFQMAYDSAFDKLFVAEGTSGGSGVWRFDIEPITGTITGVTKIVVESDRVFALSLGDEAGTPVLDYGLKRTPLIKRVTNPSTCSAPCGTVGSGAAMAGEPLGLASINGSLYIAELTGVTKIADAGALGTVAEPVANFPGGSPGAIAADPVTGRVYAGTKNGNNQDQVDVLNTATGAMETYATGLVGVSAMSVGAGGTLLVADDPDLGPESTGNGRVLSIGLTALSRPVAQITDGPGIFTNAESVSFSFSGPVDATFLCRQDPSELTPWLPCGAAGVGSSSFGSLSEGIHVLEVKAVSPDPLTGEGPVQVRTFTVDRTAPSVTIDNPAADHEVTGGAITMRFSTTDPFPAFACSLDGSAPAPCSDPRRFEGLAVGRHEFAVTAADAAGNASAPATWSFTVRGPSAGGATGEDADRGRPPLTAGEASQVFGAVQRISLELRPRSVRLVTARRTIAKLRRSRRLVLQVRAPRSARWATIALWRTNQRSVKRGRRPIAFGAVRLLKAGRNDVSLTLSARQARALRPGSYLVGVVLTDGADKVGPARYRRLTVLP